MLLACVAACLVLLPWAMPAGATAKKRLKPSTHVKSIPAKRFHPGSDVFGGRRILPFLDATGPTATSVKPAAGSGTSPQPGTVSALSSSLPGAGPPALINKEGLKKERFTPSDSTGAIGPNHYVEMINSTIAVYDRSNLQLVSSALLDNGFTNGQFIDPQIQWDQQAQRWLYLGIGPITSNNNYTLVYGWSKTSDPTDVNNLDGTSGWCQYVLPTTANQNGLILDDYPKLGHSDTQLVFGANMFSGTLSLFFVGAQVWAVPKPTNGQTTCPSAPVATAFGSSASP
jgi:hypothetical protein